MKNKNQPLYNSHLFIIVWGIFIHIILLWGVMDSNFHSPIIPGLSVIPMSKNSPAKRVFIFVADGLRYRTFKDNIPPYLNSIIQKHGVWGISHTRMPTESRPGNIAIVAGLYEDPSAVFTGWKENPIDFDSVFNKSYASWLWGSPDIISLFMKNTNYNIHSANYPANWQDFSNDPRAMKRLDLWVFNQYWKWLKYEASSYKTADKIIFFFHLLGCDTTGHARKPQSKEYVQTMMNVDLNIQEVVQKTENFFNDDATVYIFTSDHGMTDSGSHGSGSTDETETPFVAWGAGITNDSHLYHIEQTDITPLISTLIGIPIPINNEGVLPYKFLDLKYKEFIANAFLTNAKQLAEQVKANRELTVGKSIVKMYWKDKELTDKLLNAEKLFNLKQIDECIPEIKYIIKLAKESLTYYRRYQTNRFFICLVFMWFGWITFLFINSSGVQRYEIELEYYSWLLLANSILIVAFVFLMVEYIDCKEWRILCYGIISIVSVWLAFREVIKKKPILKINYNKSMIEFISIIFLIIMIFIGLKYRWTFSISMLLTTILLKFMFNKHAKSQFILTGFTLAVFPLLPTVGLQPKIYIVIIVLCISIVLIIKNKKIYKYNKLIELIRIIFTSFLCLNLIDGKSWLSWCILLSTPIAIWLYPNDWNQRFFGISMALLSPYSLLSTSYETFFFFIFTTHLQYWTIYECLQNSTFDKKVLNLRKISIAVILMFYMLLSFFGTGNIASISSFDPFWTQHFLTVFSPFSMAALIILKITIPLILVGCLVHVITPDLTIFSTVLLLGDCLAIPFMFSITTQGSWLDIGSAISRFIIVITLPCLLLFIYYLAKLFTLFSLQEFIWQVMHKKQQLKI